MNLPRPMVKAVEAMMKAAVVLHLNDTSFLS